MVTSPFEYLLHELPLNTIDSPVATLKGADDDARVWVRIELEAVTRHGIGLARTFVPA